jgi:Sulfatase
MRWLSRALVVAFCIATSLYAFLASSSFTYQQFLRPRVSQWVARFGDSHAALYWLWLLFALWSLVPEFRKAGITRKIAIGFAAAWSGVGVGLTVHPVLPTLVDDHRSVLVGLVALLPIIWLAVIDHLAVHEYLRRQPAWVTADGGDSTERRLIVAAIGTAVCVAVAYGVLTPFAIGGAFEPDLLTSGLALGLTWSLYEHLLIFCALFLLATLTERIVRSIGNFRLRYGVEFLLVTAALWIGLQRIVGNAIGLDSSSGRTAIAGLSLSIVGAWAGLRLRRWAQEGACLASGFDVFCGPPQGGRIKASTVLSLVGILAAAFMLAGVAAKIDWDFLILKLGVLTVWTVTFAQIYRASSGEVPVSRRTILVVCAAPLIACYLVAPSLQSRFLAWPGAHGSSVRHTLDRYRVYNPTFRLADDALHGRAAAETPAFDRFLKANTGLSAADVSPVEIEFVPNLQVSQLDPKPNIFLLVVDSLRADYLSPYNERVGFTPRIAEFAADSMVFRNSFARYGGTGLSMSAMWMGAAGPHRQYVQPFQPMNALEKLLNGNGYRRYVSMDHIMEQVLTVSPSLIELDRGIPEVQYDFCRTLSEIEGKLQSSDDPSPVFAHTRSLNLHVAAMTNEAVPPEESYPGFEARYSARIHRMDACFGRFIDFLKRRGLYDRSVVILTADHGEMLGEDGQWGHAYYLFPPVLEIPLILHLPSTLVPRTQVDLDAIGFSTDITPTLYAVLGYQPLRRTPLMGQSLIGTSSAELMSRRRAVEVVAASYGAVWGALRQNGRRLYIVDANHAKEYAYERPPRGPWQPVAISDALRTLNQQAIREHIDEISHEYRVNVNE